MSDIKNDIEGLLRTVAQLYALQKRRDEVEILARSKSEIIESSYDNWNGGTYGYTIILQVKTSLYVKIEDRRDSIANDIVSRLRPLLGKYDNQGIDNVKIEPEIENDENWRSNALKWLDGTRKDTVTVGSFDLFISHASEDKEKLVRPLAVALKAEGFNVWYDEFELKVGDSLSQCIDNGLVKSNYGLVVLSGSFFKKNWPRYELDGLIARQMVGKKVILPLWHNVTKEEILTYSPPLADKLALNSSTASIEEMVDEISNVIGKRKIKTV